MGINTIEGRYTKQKLHVFNIFKIGRENNSGLCEHQRKKMAFSELAVLKSYSLQLSTHVYEL